MKIELIVIKSFGALYKIIFIITHALSQVKDKDEYDIVLRGPPQIVR